MQTEFIHKDSGTLVAQVQLGVYGLDPVLAAAHKFSGRCFVHIEHLDQNVVLCRFRAKTSMDNLEHMAGEFLNEVLDQALRAKLAQKSEPIRGLLIAQAFSKTNLLNPQLDEASPQSDPSTISVPDAAQH